MNQTGALSLLVRVAPLLMSAALFGCSNEAADVASDGESVGSHEAPTAQQAQELSIQFPKLSPGCFKKRTAFSSVSVDVGGETRTASVHIPRFANILPTPVVMSFHGAGGTAEFGEQTDKLDEYADQTSAFISVHGQASGPAFYDLWGVNIFTGQPIDEAAYFRAVLDKIGEDACIDTSRVYATGISNGGWTTEYLACTAGDRLAGIAPIESTGFACPHAVNVPTVGFHGLGDVIAPWAGIPGAVIPKDENWNSIAVNNGCDLPAKVTTISATVDKLTYKHCKAATVFYRLKNHGHTWPGHPFEGAGLATVQQTLAVWQAVAWPLPWIAPADAIPALFLTNTDIDATATELAFFAVPSEKTPPIK